jgi:mycothiol synthase
MPRRSQLTDLATPSAVWEVRFPCGTRGLAGHSGMHVLSFDEGIAGSYTSEPATGAHVNEVFEILAAEQTAAFGFCPDTVEDVRAELDPAEGALSQQRLIRDREDGTPVQWWVLLQHSGDPIFHAWISSHPRLPDPIGDELARVGWATMLDLIREAAPPDQDEVTVHSGCPAGSDAGHRRLESAGFAHRRTFWEMTGPVNSDTRRTPVPVEGLTIKPTRDERTVHRILNDAFVGHWGYEPLQFDDWLAVEESLAGYDPGLWRLANLEGIAAAVMTMSRRTATQGALYVAELATLAPYRRHGLASALLAHAFDVAAAENYDRVGLHVDSENTNDAPSVYRRAGLHVRCAFHAYARTLSTHQNREAR